MFFKKTKAVKGYTYHMLLSFKTLVNLNFFLTSSRKDVSVVRQPLSDITRHFARHCPMSAANIQACQRCSAKIGVLTKFAKFC